MPPVCWWNFLQKQKTESKNMDVKTSKPLQPPDWESDDFEFPPFLRRADRGTRLATENMIQAINSKIAKLAELGLRPHSNLLEYRQELVEQLDRNGPYQLRRISGVF
jgi:hypothetical protein